MTLESRIEGRAVTELMKLGYIAVKQGKDGWPDRIVVLPNKRCVWLEFKQPKTGAVSQRQKIRANDLAKLGHKVYYPTSWQDAVDIVRAEVARPMK